MISQWCLSFDHVNCLTSHIIHISLPSFIWYWSGLKGLFHLDMRIVCQRYLIFYLFFFLWLMKNRHFNRSFHFFVSKSCFSPLKISDGDTPEIQIVFIAKIIDSSIISFFVKLCVEDRKSIFFTDENRQAFPWWDFHKEERFEESKNAHSNSYLIQSRWAKWLFICVCVVLDVFSCENVLHSSLLITRIESQNGECKN